MVLEPNLQQQLGGGPSPSLIQVKYLYDAQRRRVTRMTGTTVNERYVWLDQLRPLGVLNNAGSTVMTFFYGDRPTPEYMIKSGTTYKFFVDHVGSVRQVMNVSNGTIAQELTYDEFGRVLSDSSPGFQPFGFAGGLYDKDTKLVQFGARWYDAEVGRWLSKDPILFAGGDTNLYGYVMQDPINLTDPSGLASVCTIPAQSGSFSHSFICATGPNGKVTCGGLYPGGSFTDMLVGGPGSILPSNPSGSGASCKDVGSGCMDSCMGDMLNSSAPNYSVTGINGMNCHGFANQAVSKCKAQCGQ